MRTRRLSDIYSDDQHRRIVAAIRRGGRSADARPLSLASADRVIEPVFRGELALETICYDRTSRLSSSPN